MMSDVIFILTSFAISLYTMRVKNQALILDTIAMVMLATQCSATNIVWHSYRMLGRWWTINFMLTLIICKEQRLQHTLAIAPRTIVRVSCNRRTMVSIDLKRASRYDVRYHSTTPKNDDCSIYWQSYLFHTIDSLYFNRFFECQH